MKLDDVKASPKPFDHQDSIVIVGSPDELRAVSERSNSLSGIRPDDRGILPEDRVRELSKSLANLRLRKDDAFENGFLRYVGAFSFKTKFAYGPKDM